MRRRPATRIAAGLLLAGCALSACSGLAAPARTSESSTSSAGSKAFDTSDERKILDRYTFDNGVVTFASPGEVEGARFEIPSDYTLNDEQKDNSILLMDPNDGNTHYKIEPDLIFHKIPSNNELIEQLTSEGNTQASLIGNISYFGPYKVIGAEIPLKDGLIERMYVISVNRHTWIIRIKSSSSQKLEELQNNLESMSSIA